MTRASVARACAGSFLLLVAGCSPRQERAEVPPDPTRFPDVLEAVIRPEQGGTWAFDVTLSSPYDSPERYADAWRVLDASGNELALRVLSHDHATEQPFTRSLAGVRLPAGVSRLVFQGRDLEHGWGGGTLERELPAR